MKIGQYKKAMDYFKLGFDMKYYGKAFKLYRDGVIKKGFVPFLIAVVVLVAGGITYKYFKRKKKGYVKDEETGIGDE